MPENIIIRKQKFRIRTPDQELALRIRRHINDRLQFEVLSVYENIFGSLGHENIYIDKLSLNLGPCREAVFFEQLPEMIRESLQKKLSEQKAESVYGSEEEMIRPVKPGQTDNVIALFYFLKKGIYPWWFEDKRMKPVTLLESFSSDQAEKLLVKILTFIKSITRPEAEKIKTRLVQQINVPVFEKLMPVFIKLSGDNSFEKNIDQLTSKQTVLALSDFFSLDEPNYRKFLVEHLVDLVAEKRELSLKEFMLILQRHGKVNLNIKSKTGKIKSSSGKAKDSPGYSAKTAQSKFESLDPAVKLALNNLIKEKKEQEPGPGDSVKYEGSLMNYDGQSAMIDKDSNASRNGEADQNLLKKKHAEVGFSEEEGIYISNGGLVILHPFLAILFKELKLTDEKDQFISGENRRRAVVILNFLQTGEAEYTEQDLAFNKILCGMMPADNFPDDISLSENERNECTQLLDIVIGYWEALKGASREALRETFLTRAAKLSFNEDNWLLQVERNATDILVDRLPWGIGIIKFPWLKYLIHVEW